MEDKNTEADLEARISATLAQVFPGVQLKHQRRFKIRLGHTEFETSGKGYVDGRADILVTRDDVPLAVVELKREGLALTKDDEEQGWSYAALAKAPLVIISNGADTRILLTHDQSTLHETSLGATELVQRLATAASLAQTSVNGAIERLLGADLGLPAVRAINSFELDELSGSWTDTKPFVSDFLVPRNVTETVRSTLCAPRPRAIVVSGAPLCGKSSVLRELVTTLPTAEGTALYLDGSACSEGLFRRLSNVLTALFGWPATLDQARHWLRQIAPDTRPPLVLCIDSPGAGPVLRSEIDEILSDTLGNVRIVVSLEEAEVDAWRLKSNRRELTRFGRNSEVVTVGHYNDTEFAAANLRLAELGGGLVHGASYAAELRAPWVLRAAVAPRMEDSSLTRNVVLPPTLGLETLEIAEDRFAQLGELRDSLERVARAFVELLDSSQPAELVMASLFDFYIGREWLRERVRPEELFALVQAGLLQPGTGVVAGPLYFVRVPALFATLVAERMQTLVAKRLGQSRNIHETAQWLVSRCSRMPFGDLVGAAVINHLMMNVHDLAGLRLLNALMQMPPATKVLSKGAKWVAVLPDVGVLDFELDADNNLVVQPRDGRLPPFKAPVEEDEMRAIASHDAWLILSQTRLFNLAFRHKNMSDDVNVAAWLLQEVATCPVVLRRIRKQMDDYHVHQIGEVEMPCAKLGIVEPVTWAIAELLSSEFFKDERDAWVLEAIRADNLPLLGRLTQALKHLQKVEDLGEWASEMLKIHCNPKWEHHPSFH
ncbi:hypothetical protein ABIE09_004488 [Lysobacter enzymogenes]|uniref:type I restriction enzyme HsdR N-terminal domain-containing protein n=1 Tax=Lysobacter enzymogenes TaxID=69 RepID=UPI0033977F22